MKKTILLSAFVTAMTAFAATTGTVSASTAYSDVYTFEKPATKDETNQHTLEKAVFDSMLSLNVKNMIDDYSALELDGQVHYKGGILTGEQTLANFNKSNVKFDNDKATHLSLKYTLPKTSYGMAYLMAGVYSPDKDNASSRVMFEGDYSYKFDKVMFELNSATTFPLDNSGVTTTNKFMLSLNEGMYDSVKSAKATLTFDNDYILPTSADNITFLKKIGLDLKTELMLNSTNMLTLKGGVSSTIPMNDLDVKDNAWATLENTGMMEGLKLTGTLGYEHSYNYRTNEMAKSFAHKNTINPSLELKASYDGNIKIDASVKQKFDVELAYVSIGVGEEAVKGVVKGLKVDSETHAEVKVSKDYMPAKGLMVTPSAMLETDVLVNNIQDKDNVAVATTNDTNFKFTPAVDLSYQALENLKLTAGLSSKFMFDNTDKFAFRTVTPKVSAGLTYNW